jgi:ferritin
VFLSELAKNQVEEIEVANANYEKVKAFDNGDKMNLFLLDREF